MAACAPRAVPGSSPPACSQAGLLSPRSRNSTSLKRRSRQRPSTTSRNTRSSSRFLIADEEYTQTLFDADGRKTQTRLIKAEMFLTYLPADGEWIAVRDVIEVDGEPVKDREDLRALLAKRERAASGQAAHVAKFPLQPRAGRAELQRAHASAPAPRQRSGRRGSSSTGSVSRAKTTSRWRSWRSRNAKRPRWSRRRTRAPFAPRASSCSTRRRERFDERSFSSRGPASTSSSRPSYVKDDKLNLWLPSVFTERYESGSSIGGMRLSSYAARASKELVECEARYTNYRRFEVTARIK